MEEQASEHVVVVIDNLIKSQKNIDFKTNLSHAKARNYVKRKIMQVKEAQQQVHPHSKGALDKKRD